MVYGDLLSLDKFFQVHYDIMDYYDRRGMEREREEWLVEVKNFFSRWLKA
jgi:hypothetical protein